MAIISVLTATTAPWMIGYWRAATLKGAAEEVAAGLNRARQLAISQSQRVCVEITGNQYRYRFLSCTGTTWTGPGTIDANGFFPVTRGMTLTSNENPIFDYLGAANPGATLTVTNTQGGAALTVAVSVAGRVRICPAAGCP